ncbi:MAG: YfhO family protein [Lachnospiraceae bacterium]|nr:YfhO family protein [Lachnospiraceae bacterium]
MRKDIKEKTILCFIAGIISIFILALVYYFIGIYPGGPITILTYDMKSQYMPFFASLRYICDSTTDSSLFLNMSGSLANNFMGFAYYIYSPMTWMTTLFSLEKLPDAIYFLTLVRIGLCGVGFCYHLYYTYPEKRHKLSIILLACCYALMAYNIGYSVNIMWLDAVLMLPWILTGIEKCLREERPGMFIVSVFLTLVLNYYISFMSGIFAIGYLFIRMFELNKWNAKRFGGFVIYSLVGIGTAMPVLLPGVLALSNGRMEEDKYPVVRMFRYSFIDVLCQLTSGKYDTVMDDGLPFIFCGSLTIVLVLVYFAKSKDDVISKLRWLILIAFYLFSMCFVPLDRIMHGFQETTCFEVRYGFAFSCMLLILAYRGVDCVVKVIKDKTYQKYIKTLFAIFVLAELYMNSSILISELNVELHYGTRVDYDRILNSKQKLLGSIEDTGFYRVSENTAYTYNDAAWLGYNGFGYFSSCYNLKVMNFLGSMGENQSHHILRDGLRTPVEETLLGAKYKILYAEKPIYGKLIAYDGLYSLYEDDNALSLGYMSELKDGGTSQELSGNAFENQNIWIKELTGRTEDVFRELQHDEQISYSSDGLVQHDVFSVMISKKANIWAYFEIDNNRQLPDEKKTLKADNEMFLNGESIGEFIDPHNESAYMVFLGEHESGEKLNLEILSSKYCGIMHLFSFDEGVYHNCMNSLSKNQLYITEHSNGHFEGTIESGKCGSMLLTLPFMDGWNIKVDGKKVEYSDYRETMIVVPLDAGLHNIEIAFFPPGLITGLIIMLVSVCLGIVLALRKRISILTKMMLI